MKSHTQTHLVWVKLRSGKTLGTTWLLAAAWLLLPPGDEGPPDSPQAVDKTLTSIVTKYLSLFIAIKKFGEKSKNLHAEGQILSLLVWQMCSFPPWGFNHSWQLTVPEGRTEPSELGEEVLSILEGQPHTSDDGSEEISDLQPGQNDGRGKETAVSLWSLMVSL